MKGLFPKCSDEPHRTSPLEDTMHSYVWPDGKNKREGRLGIRRVAGSEEVPRQTGSMHGPVKQNGGLRNPQEIG